MSRKVKVTARAKADIRSIADWIARDSVTAAVRWLDDLESRFRTICDVPGTGTNREDLRPGLRSSPFGNYLIFFKATQKTLTIVRVIHGARDYRHFFEKR
jgi:toxin ParE1/3/4